MMRFQYERIEYRIKSDIFIGNKKKKMSDGVVRKLIKQGKSKGQCIIKIRKLGLKYENYPKPENNRSINK